MTNWARALVPWWLPRVVLPALWFFAFVATLGSGKDFPACRPDPAAACATWSVLAALLWGTFYAVPFLLMTRPLAGLLLAAPWGFAAEVWMYENPVPLYGIHGVLCLITLIPALNDEARRRRLCKSAAPMNGKPRPGFQPPWTLWAFPSAVAVGALLLAGFFGAAYAITESLYADRVARGTVVTGQVADFDYDWERILSVEVPDRTDPVIISVDHDYAVGDEVEVRLDPEDPDWAELTDEPANFSAALIPAGGLLLLAGVKVVRLCELWRFVGALRSGRLPEFQVLLGLHARNAYLHGYPAAGQPVGRAFAVLPVSESLTSEAPATNPLGIPRSGPTGVPC